MCSKEMLQVSGSQSVSPDQQPQHHLEIIRDLVRDADSQTPPCTAASEPLGWALQGIQEQLRPGKPILVEMGKLQNMLQWQNPGLNGLVRRKGLVPCMAQVRGVPG